MFVVSEIKHKRGVSVAGCELRSEASTSYQEFGVVQEAPHWHEEAGYKKGVNNIYYGGWWIADAPGKANFKKPLDQAPDRHAYYYFVARHFVVGTAPPVEAFWGHAFSVTVFDSRGGDLPLAFPEMNWIAWEGLVSPAPPAPPATLTRGRDPVVVRHYGPSPGGVGDWGQNPESAPPGLFLGGGTSFNDKPGAPAPTDQLHKAWSGGVPGHNYEG